MERLLLGLLVVRVQDRSTRAATQSHCLCLLGKRTPKDKNSVKLIPYMFSNACLSWAARWLASSVPPKQRGIINCTLGLVCRGPEGRVGWSAGENSLLSSEVMEWFPVLNRFSVPIVAVSALPRVRTTFVCGSEPGYRKQQCN